MDFSNEKKELREDTNRVAHNPGAENRAEKPAIEHGIPTDPEKNELEKRTQEDGITQAQQDLRHLGVDLEEEKRKRESIESRFADSSLFSPDDSDPDLDGDASSRPSGHLAVPDQRPPASRGETTRSGISTGSRRSMPPLRRKETKLAQKEAHPWQHIGLTLGLPMILLFDLIIPIIIFYTWYNNARSEWRRECDERYTAETPCPIPKPEYNKDILGYAIICFGFGELWILLARIHRLFVHPDQCAPLLSRSRWELDATSWVYAVAMIMALIPFVVGSTLEIPILYLYSPSFIMGFLGILMAITTFLPFKLPVGINSQPRGSMLRPFIYYAAEDFMAVDGLQDREFRIRYNERYETNAMFREFFLYLTLWWMLGVCVYIGSVSAIIFTVEFHIAFGLSFGVLFAYIACWAGVTVLWVNYEMKREHRVYEAEEVDG